VIGRRGERTGAEEDVWAPLRLEEEEGRVKRFEVALFPRASGASTRSGGRFGSTTRKRYKQRRHTKHMIQKGD
jgi:hypothetical protein